MATKKLYFVCGADGQTTLLPPTSKGSVAILGLDEYLTSVSGGSRVPRIFWSIDLGPDLAGDREGGKYKK